jgi:hypothetical protein
MAGEKKTALVFYNDGGKSLLSVGGRHRGDEPALNVPNRFSIAGTQAVEEALCDGHGGVGAQRPASSAPSTWRGAARA